MLFFFLSKGGGAQTERIFFPLVQNGLESCDVIGAIESHRQTVTAQLMKKEKGKKKTLLGLVRFGFLFLFLVELGGANGESIERRNSGNQQETLGGFL